MEVLHLFIDILNFNLSTCLEIVRTSSLSSVPTRVYIVLSKVVLVMLLLLRRVGWFLSFDLVYHLHVGLTVLCAEFLAVSSEAETSWVHFLALVVGEVVHEHVAQLVVCFSANESGRLILFPEEDASVVLAVVVVELVGELVYELNLGHCCGFLLT